jgi:hypothetical protein
MTRKTKRELERELIDLAPDRERDAEVWVTSYVERTSPEEFSFSVTFGDEAAPDTPTRTYGTPAGEEPGRVVLIREESDLSTYERTAPVEDVPEWIDLEEELPI